MYIIDLFANIFRKKNFGVLIWLIINTALVTAVFGLIITEAFSVHEPILAFGIGFVIYLVTVIAALSPVGEAILRWQTGCRKISDPETAARIERLFNEVKTAAVNADPSLERKIKFFISDDEAPNAFATGRKTVCITKGLLGLSDEQIKGVLAHEFGHLSHKDTDVILVVAVGNMFVTLFAMLASAIVRLFNWIFGFMLSLAIEEGGCVIGFLTSLTNGAVSLIFGGIMWLWTKLGVLICMTSSRQNEYFADEFARIIGYDNNLHDALLALEGGELPKAKGLWATLNSSHPETAKRLEKLSACTYSSSAYSCNSNSVTVDCEAETMYISPEEYNAYAESLAACRQAEKSWNDGETVLLLKGFSGMPESLAEKVAKPEPQPPVNKAPEVPVQPAVQAPPVYAPQPAKPSPEPVPVAGSIPGLKFHKFNTCFYLPFSAIGSLIMLVGYAGTLVMYGATIPRFIAVVCLVAQMVFAISSLAEFRKKNRRALPSLLISVCFGLLGPCIMIPDFFTAFEAAGFDPIAAAVYIIISTVISGIYFFVSYGYYPKRSAILFDN